MIRCRLRIEMDPVKDGIFDIEEVKLESSVNDDIEESYEDDEDEEKYLLLMVSSKGDFVDLSEDEFNVHRFNLCRNGRYAAMKLTDKVDLEFDYRHVIKVNDDTVFVGTALIRAIVGRNESRKDCFVRIMEALYMVIIPIEVGNDVVSGFLVNDAEIVEDKIKRKNQ
jgi:hypothetical protein